MTKWHKKARQAWQAIVLLYRRIERLENDLDEAYLTIDEYADFVDEILAVDIADKMVNDEADRDLNELKSERDSWCKMFYKEQAKTQKAQNDFDTQSALVSVLFKQANDHTTEIARLARDLKEARERNTTVEKAATYHMEDAARYKDELGVANETIEQLEASIRKANERIAELEKAVRL